MLCEKGPYIITVGHKFIFIQSFLVQKNSEIGMSSLKKHILLLSCYILHGPSSPSSTFTAFPKPTASATGDTLNLLAPELFFLILAHPVYKM